jgi:hypothetical protein
MRRKARQRPEIQSPSMQMRKQIHPRSVNNRRGGEKAVSYVQPSTFDMLAGASPASAMDGWAE